MELFVTGSFSSRRLFNRCLHFLTILLATSIGAIPSYAQSVVATIPTGLSPLGVAVNPVTNKAYVVNANDSNVVVIDANTGLSQMIAVRSTPYAVAVNTVTNQIYVANRASNNVSVIDGSANTVVQTITVGASPQAIIVNTQTNKIYVANNGDNTVSVIDGTSGNVATIQVGSNPSAIALNPATNIVYVTNAPIGSAGSVSVINGASDSVTATVTVDQSPVSVAVNPVTDKIYVTNSTASTVSVMDGAINSVATTISLPANSGPAAAAVNPVTNRIYVANKTAGTVSVIDGSSDTSLGQITAGSSAQAIAINSITNQIYVVNSNSNNVTIIDGATGSPSSITVGTLPQAVAVNPVANKVYVVNRASGNVSVIDSAVNAVTIPPATPQPATSQTTAVAVNPVTNKIYLTDQNFPVSSSQPGFITVIDEVANTSSQVTAGVSPRAAAVNPATNKVYVANTGDNTVTVVDGSANTVLSTVAVGSSPTGVVVNPVTNRIYVANQGSSNVSVLDGTGDTVIATVAAGNQISGIAVNPVTNRIYVVNQNSSPQAQGTVTVIDGVSNEVITTISVGMVPICIGIDSVRNKIYVGNYLVPGQSTSTDNTVMIIDGATNAVTSTLPIGGRPYSLAINQITNRIYVANNGQSTISIIDGASRVVSSKPAGFQPLFIAINPVTNQVYATSSGGSNTVTVLDGQTFTPTTVTVGLTNASPNAIAVNTNSNRVYIPTFRFVGGFNNGLSILNVDNHQTVPLVTTIAGVVDAQIISTQNVFKTTNTAPSFTVDVTSSYGATNPPPTHVYYAVDGGAPAGLGTVTTSTGANPASFGITVPQQQVGLHTLYVYASYGNESGHNASNSVTGNSPELGNLTSYVFLIVPYATATVVTSDVNPQSAGANVTFTATVTTPATGISGPTGSLAFYDGTTLLGTSTLQQVPGSYIATLQTNSLTPGSHTITASYSGDSSYIGSSGTMTQNIVAVTLASSINPSTYGQQVTFTATVASGATGQVTFADGTTTLGTSSVSGGQAVFTTSALSVSANHPITASYQGDGTHPGGLSNTVQEAVTPAVITVSSTPVSRPYGQPNPTLTPTYSGFANNDSSSVISGTPSLATTATTASAPAVYPVNIDVGTLTATNYTFVSAPGTLTVVKATPGQNGTAAVTITSSLNPSVYGNAVTFTSTVPADATGTITFFDNNTSLGTGTIANGVATLITSALAVTTHPIRAQYNGDTNYNNASSPTLSQVVNRAPGSVTVDVSPNPGVQGNSETLTATVPAGQTGTVTFYDGTTALGTATIANGVATLSVSTFTPGSHNISASYNGDNNYAPATSSTKALVINSSADFAISNKTGAQIIPPGASASFNISITSVTSPFTNAVTLTANNLPTGATYTYSPSSVTPGAAGASSTFTVAVPKQTVALHRSSRTPLALAIFLLPFAALRRARAKPRRLLIWLLITAGLGTTTGCGTGGYFSQPQQTYVITVTGTSGSLVHSTTATLTVE